MALRAIGHPVGCEECPQQLPGHHRAGRRRRTRGGAGLPAAVLLASGGAGEVRSGADRRAADVLPGLYHGLLSQRVRAVPAALAGPASARHALRLGRSEEHTSELQSLMRISYAVFCLKKKKKQSTTTLH